LPSYLAEEGRRKQSVARWVSDNPLRWLLGRVGDGGLRAFYRHFDLQLTGALED
jgi:hypothetical protein